MTRTQYLELRNSNLINNILYQFYLDKCNEQGKHSMSPNEFIMIFSMWPHANRAADEILSYYDIKFEITKLEHPQKGVMKYY